MGKREGWTRSKNQGGRGSSTSGRPAARVLGLTLIAGLSLGLWLALGPSGAGAAQARGGPRLMVDTDLVDLGVVPFNQRVRASFRLRNVGDQPLRLPASPPLEVIEGC